MESNHIDTNIKDKLNDYEHFDGDKMAMWAAIDEGLGEKKKKRRFLFWFWFGGLSLAIVFLSLIFWLKDSTTTATTSNTNHTDTPAMTSISNDRKVETIKETNIRISNVNDESSQNPSTQETMTQNNATNKNEQTALGTKKTDIEKIISMDNAINQELSQTTAVKQSATDSAKANTTTIEKRATDKKSIGSILKDNLSKKLNNKSTNTVINTSLLELKNTSVPSLSTDSIIAQIEIQTIENMCLPPPPPPADNELQWSLNTAMGINNHISSYQSDSNFSELRNDSETNLQGWQVQLELSRHFSHEISLTSGIQFSRAWTKFEFDEEKMTETVIEGIVTTYHINTHWFMNDTILEYGDAIVTGETKREVQHHNRFDKIQIPVMIAKHFKKGKISFACQTGVGLDIWMHRSGKNLNIDGVVSSFQDDSDDYTKIGYSIKLRTLLGFAITDRINIYMQPSGNLSLSDWSPSGDGLTRKPFTYGLNLGARLRIK